MSFIERAPNRGEQRRNMENRSTLVLVGRQRSIVAESMPATLSWPA